jgi:YggT family protein
MASLIIGSQLVLGLVRSVVAVIIGVLAVICIIDWMVRTRRINPFNPLARFARQVVDPIILPMERRVVRAGGLPSSAPWWTLALAVVIGILVITLMDFLYHQLTGILFALQSGPRGFFLLLVQWTFLILKGALLIRVITSWLPISPFSPWVRWAFAITEPMLRPIRSIVPTLGMFDLSPLIAYFVLGLLEGVMLRSGGFTLM